MTGPKGARDTIQRRRILRVLQTAGCHLTAREIHRRVGQDGRAVGLATIYRALGAFVRSGVAERASIGGAIRYGLASEHHDHLVCLGCGRWQPLDHCLAPRAPRGVAPGFSITGHRLEFLGYCAQCR